MRRIIDKNSIKVIALTGTVIATMLVAACGADNKDSNKEKKTDVVTTNEVTTTEVPTTDNIDIQAVTETVTTEEIITEEAATTENATSLDMHGLYEKIAKVANLPDMYELDDSDLMDWYGMDVAADCTDYAFYTCEVSPGVDTVGLFVCKDKQSVENVVETLEIALDGFKMTTEDYAPEEYEKASKAQVKTKGNFVYLIVCSDLDAAESVID